MAYNRSAQRGTWFEEQQSMINSASDSELRSLGDTFDENFETTVRLLPLLSGCVNINSIKTDNLKVVANYLPGFKLTTSPIYLLNSGNAPANLIMAFKFNPNMDEIKIKIDKVFIDKEKDFTGPLSWTTKEENYSEIILTSPKKYRPYQDFLAVEGRNTENGR